MDFVFLVWLFAGAITLHNLEEAIWLPRWSKKAGRWHRPVGEREFRFAVVALTLLAYFFAGGAVAGGKESASAYLLSGYALAMLLNVLFPHVAATIIMRRYVPGTLTALLFNMPVTVLLLRQGLQEGYIHFQRLAWAGPLVVVGMIVSVPVLFALGRQLPGVSKS